MKCIICGVDIDPRRIKILPKTKTCVNHSLEEKKEALNIRLGEKEDTFDEIIILEKTQIKNILNSEILPEFDNNEEECQKEDPQ